MVTIMIERGPKCCAQRTSSGQGRGRWSMVTNLCTGDSKVYNGCDRFSKKLGCDDCSSRFPIRASFPQIISPQTYRCLGRTFQIHPWKFPSTVSCNIHVKSPARFASIPIGKVTPGLYDVCIEFGFFNDITMRAMEHRILWRS